MQFIPNCIAHVQVLPFIRIATEMNEEEERATLENFLDSSLLELLLNEKQKMKRISFIRLIGNHTYGNLFSCGNYISIKKIESFIAFYIN